MNRSCRLSSSNSTICCHSLFTSCTYFWTKRKKFKVLELGQCSQIHPRQVYQSISKLAELCYSFHSVNITICLGLTIQSTVGFTFDRWMRFEDTLNFKHLGEMILLFIIIFLKFFVSRWFSYRYIIL